MRELTATLCLTIAVLLGSAGVSYSQGVGGKWTVTEHSGEYWYISPNDVVGKTQYFFKGMSEGVFLNCDYDGQSYTYTTYDKDEFLGNKEFELFKKLKVLEIYDGKVFVHRITCGGLKTGRRQVLYPFVTIKPDWTRAFYLFEGGIFTLKYSSQ
jgi:hypothetical protein